ncbi:hypothetical protein TRAPUB_908 [Trametes pubescens]|uniref:Uncharacterized protein n=1 Tax=Trametes pubescens TaxID=154538 RepID=A0A1M2VKR6_TRAPU|nr:hypothetical protein TRAPUB_908 [Trametes pubescens]
MSFPNANTDARGRHADARASAPAGQGRDLGPNAPLFVDHPIMGGEIRRIVPRARPTTPVSTSAGADLDITESVAGGEDSDQQDGDGSPNANILDLPEVPEGRARVYFEHGGWSTFPTPPSAADAFIVTVEGRSSEGDQHIKTRTITLPSTLSAARAIDYRGWDTYMRDIRRRFGDLLNNEQIDSLMNMAYVYLWFSRQPLTDRGENDARVVSLWNDLQQLQTTAAAMGVYLSTPGEDLLMNDAFPEPFPDDPNLQALEGEDGGDSDV